MAGFFDLEETQIIRGDEVRKKGESHPFANATCDSCGLYRTCISPRMKPTGEGRLGILIVAEAPGKTEDQMGVQLVGETGKLLRKLLQEIDLDLDRDFWKTNAICCRPPKNADPEPLQLAACRKRLMAAIDRFQPKAIITLGKFAVEGLIGHRLAGRLGEKDPSMGDWAGCFIPDQELGRWLCPTWHPSFIARSNEDPVLVKQLKYTFKRAIELSKEPFPAADYMAKCSVIYKELEAIAILRDLRMKGGVAALDYETTGKKPHREGHRIVTSSVSDGDIAYAFPFFKDPDFRQDWRKFLLTPKLRRVAHNSKFEMVWTKVKLGYWPNIEEDTMLVAHSLHNKKPSNLKFQTYINFGVLGYDAEIDPYLKTPDKEEEEHGANGFNLIDQAPLDKLLLYNAADSLFTRLLRDKQKTEIAPLLENGVNFFMGATRRLAEAENNGILLDQKEEQEKETEMTRKMNQLEAKVMAMPELKKWDRSTPFRLSAPADLTHLLFDVMKYKAKEFTESGRPKGDKYTLEKIDEPIVKLVLEWRKWQKARDTYIKDFKREAIDGIIHPFFNLLLVTFRSSSDSPNFQNIPKRQKDVAKAIRAMLRPHPGHRLVEYDFKAAEVCVSACYHKDPNMIRYIEDPSSDMHRDTGCDIFIKTRETLTKEERQIAKNGFVFPEFYGSYFEQVAPDIWDDINAETKAHLKNEGIRNLRDFTAHIRDIEDKFWGERFPVYAEWKKKTYRDYLKKGYVDLYTGFRCYGPMTKNEVVNYPIQGSAFHCLLWTFVEVAKEMERQEMRSMKMGEIHDSSVDSVHPEEEAEVDRLMWDHVTNKIREYWNWIIVPLSIEKARSQIDGSWAEMEDCGILRF